MMEGWLLFVACLGIVLQLGVIVLLIRLIFALSAREIHVENATHSHKETAALVRDVLTGRWAPKVPPSGKSKTRWRLGTHP